jgi:IS5 family transposase
LEGVELRDWSSYNHELVRRGEIYLEPGFLDRWDEELEEMNEGKPGRPYQFPESFIYFAATFYTFFRLPFRQLEGFLNRLQEFLPGLKSSHYTTLHLRMKELQLEPWTLDTEEPLVAALDSTGLKITDRGEWVREKHGKKRRGWVKIHVAVNVETCELVSFQVTDETVHDTEVLEDLIQGLDLENCLGDGAYDSHQNFDLLEKLISEPGPPGIKTRRNSVVTGHTPRDKAVKERQQLGYEDWKEKHRYGKRWMAETFFSNIKRCFGETIRAKTPETATKEVERKLLMYNTVARMAKAT